MVRFVLPVFITSGQARPGGQGLFEWAKGLAYLWLQQVRSAENPFVHSSWPALANSGQVADQGALGLGCASSCTMFGMGPVSHYW